jgi:hypothetical protein
LGGNVFGWVVVGEKELRGIIWVIGRVRAEKCFLCAGVRGGAAFFVEKVGRKSFVGKKSNQKSYRLEVV